MNYLKTFLISIGASLLVAFVIFNLPFGIIDLNAEQSLGATITTIQGTDRLKDSRAVINTNFTNLNTDKMEVATTSVGNIISLPNLSTIGTIGTGIWNGTAIGVAYNGTGTTSPTSKQLMIGNGSSGFQVIGFGASGQSLVSGGDATLPSWSSVGVDEAGNFTWTGLHDFTATTTMATTTIDNAILTNATLASTTINEWATASTSIVSKGYFDVNLIANFSAAASDNTRYTAATERSETSSTYVLQKEFKVGIKGVYRVEFDMKRTGTNENVFGRIYKNGVAHGTEQSTADNTYSGATIFTEDLTFAAGDLVQLYTKQGGGGSQADVKNYKLEYDIYYDSVINTD